MAPLAEAVTAARHRWGDHVPAGPSQAETEDPALIEWRETMAPWADEEYANARAQVFIAALELHKALIAAQPEVFEANLAALMDLISAGPVSGASPVPASPLPAGSEPDGARHAAVLLDAWHSFFLVVPVVRVPFEAAGSLFDGLPPGALGWLLAAGQPAAGDVPRDVVPGLVRCFDRAVFAGDGVLAADSRYGTWLPAGPPDAAGPPKDAGPRWIGMPLRVVRGQDRTTVDQRNDLDYDGLLIAGRD
jgi:hypothetical protein